MNPKKWSAAAVALLLLVFYNGAQPDLYAMRTNPSIFPGTKNIPERYGPSYEWLDRAMGRTSGSEKFAKQTKLDFGVLSSMMVAGLASGFRSQVANLLWLKFDEYFHSGELQRQAPLMEAVVTLDPNFIDAWRTIGWHWSYNVYAYVLDNPENKITKEMTEAQKATIQKRIRRQQNDALELGLDYLRRGANANPDTYAIWFDQAHTRAWKAGLMDDEAIALYQQARQQKDARTIKSEQVIGGKAQPKLTEGMDVVGHMMAHVYEQQPDIAKALDTWREIMMSNSPNAFVPASAPKVTAADIVQLQKVGEYWALYGSSYEKIVGIYSDSDAAIKAQIKSIIPDIETMTKAHQARSRTSIGEPTPTGAYITLAARYWPTWKLMQSGKTEDAIRQLIGVMNADPKYYLKGLPALARVLEVHGDAPQVIAAQLAQIRAVEQTAASQDIGLHFLARLYEKMAAKSAGAEKKRFEKLAYEIWYRGRMRDALDFYSLRESYKYEDRGFKLTPQLMDQLDKQRGKQSFAPKKSPI